MGWDKNYIGETWGSIKKHTHGHIRYFKIGNTSEVYILETKYSFNHNDSKMLINLHNKQHRKGIESSILSNYNTDRNWAGFYNLTAYLVKLALNYLNIPCLNYLY